MSPTAGQSHTTAGDRFLAGEVLSAPRLERAIAELVGQVCSVAARLTGVRPPQPDRQAAYEDLIRRAGAVRGRGLLYPCLGSGVGHGALVELADGSVKWDMICGIGVHFFGHSDPDLLAAAVRGALEDALKHGNLQATWSPYAFAEALVEAASRRSRLRHAYLSPGGALANENALKVCLHKRAPASRVIAFDNCFMGRTTTMSEIGDAPAYRVGLPVRTPVDYLPFWDPVAAEAAGGKEAFIDVVVSRLRRVIERYPAQHACCVFELVQGEGGFNVGDRDFFVALMSVCREHGIPVWVDEIQTFGRLPAMFAFEYFDLGSYVDVVTVGKMTQVCATLFTPEMNPAPGLLSATFLGDGPSFHVGLRVLQRLREGNYYGPGGTIEAHHAEFRRGVAELVRRHPAWFPPVPGLHDVAGGLGGMMRFTPFAGRQEAIVRACHTIFEEGVILFYAGHGPYHLRMLPPLGTMRLDDWPQVFTCVERGLERAAAGP